MKARAVPGLDGTRLIALSGYAQPEDVRRAVEAGASGTWRTSPVMTTCVVPDGRSSRTMT